MLLSIVQWSILAWACIKILDLVIEMCGFLGGDGVQPYDIMWWICRPFSFRGFALFSLPMLVGLMVWIIMIYGVSWSIQGIFF